MVSPGLSSTPANSEPIITELAPAAIALVTSPEYLMPPSAITGMPRSRAARYASATAVICGMPARAGMPQITAVAEAYRAARERGIPVIADGGIKYSGEVTKAIAAGASSVMIGSLFAGVDESPGETILYQGRSFKS